MLGSWNKGCFCGFPMAPERIWAQFQEIPLGPLPPPSPKMTLGPLTLQLVSSSSSFLILPTLCSLNGPAYPALYSGTSLLF